MELLRRPLRGRWSPRGRWVINSIGDFTQAGGDYSIAILTSNNPTMDYGVATVQAVASAINRELG